MNFSEDPYKTLGIERTADEAEIKQAYFALVREHPPERDPEGFKRIRAAYEKLRDSGERTETDLFLVEEQSDTLAASAIRQFNVEPIPVTIETIKSDLLNLEAVLLLEEIHAKSKHKRMRQDLQD
jgi:curved DNA-binding protein CbpA